MSPGKDIWGDDDDDVDNDNDCVCIWYVCMHP